MCQKLKILLPWVTNRFLLNIRNYCCSCTELVDPEGKRHSLLGYDITGFGQRFISLSFYYISSFNHIFKIDNNPLNMEQLSKMLIFVQFFKKQGECDDGVGYPIFRERDGCHVIIFVLCSLVCVKQAKREASLMCLVVLNGIFVKWTKILVFLK